MSHKILILVLVGCALNIREVATNEVDVIGLGVQVESNTVAVVNGGADQDPQRMTITSRQATKLRQLNGRYQYYQAGFQAKVNDLRHACISDVNHDSDNCNCKALIDSRIDKMNLRLALYRRKALTILNIPGPSNGHASSNNRGGSGSSESYVSSSSNEDN